jgi:hypothetical protein
MDYVDFAVIYDEFMEYIKEFDEQHGINFIKGFIETMEKNNGNR